MSTILHTAPQDSPAWHALRRVRYGASETPTTCGLATYLTEGELWRAKLGHTIAPGRDELQQAIGHALEPLALEWAARTLGETTMRGAVLVQERGWLLASLDACTPALEPIDAKVRGAGSPDHALYTAETIPGSTALQLTQQAALLWELTGRRPEAAHVSALLGDRYGWAHHLYRLELTPEHWDRWGDDWSRQPGRWHQHHVVEGHPPDDATTADVAVLVEPTKVQRREATDEELALVAALAQAEAERRAADKRAAEAGKARDAVRDELARRIGPNETIPGLTWKNRRGLAPLLTLEVR